MGGLFSKPNSKNSKSALEVRAHAPSVNSRSVPKATKHSPNERSDSVATPSADKPRDLKEQLVDFFDENYRDRNKRRINTRPLLHTLIENQQFPALVTLVDECSRELLNSEEFLGHDFSFSARAGRKARELLKQQLNTPAAAKIFWVVKINYDSLIFWRQLACLEEKRNTRSQVLHSSNFTMKRPQQPFTRHEFDMLAGYYCFKNKFHTDRFITSAEIAYVAVCDNDPQKNEKSETAYKYLKICHDRFPKIFPKPPNKDEYKRSATLQREIYDDFRNNICQRVESILQIGARYGDYPCLEALIKVLHKPLETDTQLEIDTLNDNEKLNLCEKMFELATHIQIIHGNLAKLALAYVHYAKGIVYLNIATEKRKTLATSPSFARTNHSIMPASIDIMALGRFIDDLTRKFHNVSQYSDLVNTYYKSATIMLIFLVIDLIQKRKLTPHQLWHMSTYHHIVNRFENTTHRLFYQSSSGGSIDTAEVYRHERLGIAELRKTMDCMLELSLSEGDLHEILHNASAGKGWGNLSTSPEGCENISACVSYYKSQLEYSVENYGTHIEPTISQAETDSDATQLTLGKVSV